MAKKDSELTDSQRSLLAAIEEFRMREGIPPTTRELAEMLGMAAASVHEQIRRLERKGFIRRRARQARSLEVVRLPEECSSTGPTRLVRVPVLGRIAAGEPLLAVEGHDEAIYVDADSIGTGQFFALRVKGDSMIDAGIHEGDLVVVRRQPVASSGDIVAALLGDEATVKRLRIGRDGVFLIPENERYQPITVTLRDDFRVLGVVVSVVSVSR